MLRTGVKRLFVTERGQWRELTPVCVLDFYVHESCQRQGVGLKLFEHFLAAERQSPARLAYDRPSPKLLGFVSKHYGLKSFTPQVGQRWKEPQRSRVLLQVAPAHTRAHKGTQALLFTYAVRPDAGDSE